MKSLKEQMEDLKEYCVDFTEGNTEFERYYCHGVDDMFDSIKAIHILFMRYRNNPHGLKKNEPLVWKQFIKYLGELTGEVEMDYHGDEILERYAGTYNNWLSDFCFGMI